MIPTPIFKKILILFILFFIINCTSSDIVQNIDAENNKNSSKVSGNQDRPPLLRLTYYLAFRPPPDYVMLEKGDVDERGNRYKISFSPIGGIFSQMRISSTNSENKSRFQYEIPKVEFEKAKWKKYYYHPVQDELNQASLAVFSCKKNLTCLRWEWNYKGFLIVFESEGEMPPLEKAEEEMGKTFHSLVEKHLLLY